MLKMPLPSNERRKPTFCKTASTLNSVANKITPNNLNTPEYTSCRGERK